MFREQDWKSLERTFDSGKSKEPTTTGKFGIGFRSNFHMTDTPFILSGLVLRYFDPSDPPVLLDPNPGCKWTMNSSDSTQVSLNREKSTLELQLENLLESILDRFQGICGFDKNEFLKGNPYKGTLFYLPFRTKEKKGNISETIYIPSMVEELWNKYYERDLTRALLFMRSILTISFSKISENSNLETFISSQSLETNQSEERQKIQQFISDNSKDLFNAITQEHEITCNYVASITMKTGTETEKVDWLIFSKFDTTKSKNFCQENKFLGIPWIAMAIQLSTDSIVPLEGEG